MIKLLNHWIHRRPFNSSTEVRITYQCTQRCLQCAIPYKNSHTMNLDEFALVMRRLKHYGAYVGFISGGEATLVEDLPDMLRIARKTFSYATTLVTGLYHREEVIARVADTCLRQGIHIQTSFDGLGDTGDIIRGVNQFSDIVTERMRMIAAMRKSLTPPKKQPSLLYANIVISNKNIEQIPDLIAHVRSLGWKVTIGLYHHLTASTRENDSMTIRDDDRLEKLVRFLHRNPDIMNLPDYISGILPFIRQPYLGWCPFVRSPFLSTRLTIMENGDVHLCKGKPIGNIFQQTLHSIFSGSLYKERMQEYQSCSGCWTTCYTQRYLLVHPGSFRGWMSNLHHLRKIRRVEKL